MALSPSLSGCLVTASNDQSVKIWDVRDHSSPELVRQRLCKIGEIHCAAACPDEPLLFCVGGDFEMKLLNFHGDETVAKKFGVLNANVADETVADSHGSNSDLSSDTLSKSRKTKNLSPDDPNVVSKPSKSNGTDYKVSKKSKKSIVEPDFHDSNSGRSALSLDTVSISRKMKITSPSLSPDDPNAVSKPHKSNGSDHKVSKKLKSVVEPDISGCSDLSSDTVTKSRKTKITSPSLSPDNVSKPSKSTGTEHKVSKKLKKSIVEPESSASKVKSSVKSKHLKNKDFKNTEADS